MTRARRAQVEAEQTVAGYSTLSFRFFAWLFTRDFVANFHAVRVLGSSPQPDVGPLVVVANHPSWWDGALFVWMSSALLDGRRCFTPMEARMLKRYSFFAKLGAFAVEPGTFGGASSFLATAEHVLKATEGAILINAEGHFADVRARPLAIAPGIAHLARRVPEATFVPLAIEYAFWDERRPNVLMRFGEPIPARSLAARSVTEINERFSDALAAALDELAKASMTRDPRLFRTVLAGRVGINAFYDLWRRARSALHRQRFSPAHGDNA